MEQLQINKPKGVFSASMITNLLAEGTGKTKQSYILELCLDIMGLGKRFETDATRHGTATEELAFEYHVKDLYKNSVYQSNVYIPINDYCGASPDVLIGNDVLDIKCPQMQGYYSAKWQTSKQYKDQIQMQLLATGGDVGYLFYYLSKPVTYDNADVWEEYEFKEESDQYFIKEFKKDVKVQEFILSEVEKAQPVKIEMLDKLMNANLVYFEFLNEYAKSGGTWGRLKECSNILKADIFRFEDEFYYFKKI